VYQDQPTMTTLFQQFLVHDENDGLTRANVPSPI